MNLEQRISFIKENILNKGGYTIAAKECLQIIEFALRELLLRRFSILDEVTQRKIHEEEKKIAKGGRGKSIQEFTMGQLLDIMRKTDFINAWGKAANKELINIRMINLDSLTALRNDLTHNAAEANDTQARFLFESLRLIIETFGIESLENDNLTDLTQLPALVNLPNPYRGLEAFREQDAKNFFGRDAESKDLVELVEKRHFVAVLGSSGSGKSSLVFAGLIPQLRQNSQWLIATCRPQNAPLREISVTLIDALYQTELNEINRISEIKALTAGLEQETLELTDIIARVFDKHPDTRLLLVIDQFEELYTLSPTTTQSLFLNHLLNFLEQHTTPPKTTVLITLRADFLGYALNHPKLAKLLDTYRNKMLGDLSGADLSLAIEQPARALDVTFEEGLAERIVRDVGEQAGSLPLLQFALQQLWERRDQNRLTHAGYEVLGTVTQALAHHADQVYERFSDPGKTLFRQLFVQMVRPGEGTEDTRQVMVLPADPARHEIIRQLANERLVVTCHDANTGENTVEIAHEALIRHWQRLKEWMKEDRSFRVWQENLRAYMRDQVLLRDAQLAIAQEWVVQRDSELTEAERSFIQASVAQRNAELAEKRRNQRRWTVFVMIFFMVALGLSGLAAWFWQTSKQNAQLAEQKAQEAQEKLTQSKINQSLMLSGLAEIQLKEDKPATAMRIALEALPNVSETHPNRPFVAQAYDMLSRGINRQYQGVFEHEGEVNAVVISPDGKFVLTTSETAQVWDIQSGQLLFTLQPLQHDNWVSSATYSPNGTRIVTASSDKAAKIWDAHNGQLLRTLQHDDGVTSAAYSSDGTRIVTASSDTAKIWDAHSGQLLLTLQHDNEVTSATYSPDGTRIVTTPSSMSFDKTAKIWDAHNGQLLRTLQHDDGVTSAAYNSNGTRIVTASDDKTARIWDIETGQLIAILHGHEDGVNSSVFSPDDSRIVTASDDKTARIWDAQTGKLLFILQGHTGEVNSAVFSPDGSNILTTDSDGSPRLWDTKTGKELAILEQEGSQHTRIRSVISRVLDFFSPNGMRIITASKNTVQLWDTQTGQFIAILQGNNRNEDSVRSARFSKDSSMVIIEFSNEKTLEKTLWNANTGKLLTSKIIEEKHEKLWFGSLDVDGKRELSFYENTALVEDTETRRYIATLKGHKGDINSASFSPDGTRIVTASADNTARIWLTFPTLEEMIDYAKKMLPPRISEDKRDAGIENFRLTCAEREQFFLEEIERCKITKN